jgi:tetratricopeptide (TPR) repeat protein
MKVFITCNGLSALAGLISSDNLYLRGQVLEIILCATDCDVYDWFKAPDSYADKVLHQNMIGFARAPTTLSRLFANRTGSYPGGSFRALQIIAFALSWLRALYTSDQKLQLSRTAVLDLEKWKEGKAGANGDGTESAEKEDGEAPQVDPEYQLAKALLEDFTGPNNVVPSGESHADEAYLATALNTASLADTTALGTAPAVATAVVPVQAQESTPAAIGTTPAVSGAATSQTNAAQSAQDLKEKGNAEFKAGRYASAQQWYYQALSALSSEGGDDHTRAALHSNAATAAWKIAQLCLAAKPELELQFYPSISGDAGVASSNNSISSSDEAEDEFLRALNSCVADCRAALAVLPGSCKAAYRLAAVLLLQNNPSSALRAVVDCIDAHSSPAGKLSSGQTGADAEENSTASADLELLLQMKRRCTAAVLLAQRDSGTAPAQDVGLSGKVSEVLRNLLVQYQIELDLPAPGSKAETTATKPAGTTSVPISDPAGTIPSTAPVATIITAAAAVDKSAPGKSASGSDAAKPKKKKVKESSGGTSSMAKRLQQIDDDLLDALMSRPIKS